MSGLQILADAVLALHVAVVAFVVGGLVVIFVGNGLRWPFVNGIVFRLAHLGAIGFIVAQAWLGRVCPLTSLEMWLRTRAHQATYEGSFIEYWLQRVLYYQAPSWVFLLGYTSFGLLVAAAWWYFPPRRSVRSTHA